MSSSKYLMVFGFLWAGVCLLLFVLSQGCTYSINMIHTEGEAADIVDETNTPSTNLSVPISGV